MVDETSGDIVPVQTGVEHTGFDREAERHLTLEEVIHAASERKHLIWVLKNARILLDPKPIPGVTAGEALEFLMKGLKPDHPEELKKNDKF